MATISGISIYDKNVYSTWVEQVANRIDQINSRSANTIMVNNEGMMGQFSYEDFIKVGGSIYSRDSASTSGVDFGAVTNGDYIAVKKEFGWGVEVPAGVLQSGDKAIERYLIAVVSSYVDKKLEYELNTGINACVGAMLNNSSVVNNVISAGVGLDTAGLFTINQTMGKFGDRRSAIKALVMTGMNLTRIAGQAITNSSYQINSATIYDGSAPTLGLPVIVIDAEGLFLDDSTDENYVLGLTEGAIVIKEQNDITAESNNVGSKVQNIVNMMQFNGSFGLNLKGYKWNVTAGGASPSDAAIATGTNWVQSTTSHKDTAGVILRARDVGATS